MPMMNGMKVLSIVMKHNMYSGYQMSNFATISFGASCRVTLDHIYGMLNFTDSIVLAKEGLGRKKKYDKITHSLSSRYVLCH